ncbi:MAG TPA: ArsI/CadI family heavy metal resistance metalloenzyme [Pyrinomonadaceae bacterium]|nr:ArsI/CadI family heavy metal resistance metalloenzyme [Pyrinomonadaceae bacterium]
MSNNTEIKTLKAHLALNVRNVEQSIEFYKKMLGIDPSKVRSGYAKFDVQNPPLNLTLNQHPFNERGALSHLGIQVAATEDVLAMRERWREKGLVTEDEMQTNCCYALQDKTWVHDPDGNEWEVFVVLEDNLEETSTCCVAAEGETNAPIKLTAAATEAQEENSPDFAVSCCAPAAAPVSINRISEKSCC